MIEDVLEVEHLARQTAKVGQMAKARRMAVAESKGGYRLGIVTSDQILDAIETSHHDPLEKERQQAALNNGWETMINVLSHGGAITRNGQIIPFQITQLPLEYQKRISQNVVLQSTVGEAKKLFGIITDFEPKEALYFISKDAMRNIGYVMTRGNSVMSIVRINKSSDSEGNEFFDISLDGSLIDAFSNVMKDAYVKHQAQEMISPRFAVRQMMREIADTWGIGKQESSPRSSLARLNKK